MKTTPTFYAFCITTLFEQAWYTIPHIYIYTQVNKVDIEQLDIEQLGIEQLDIEQLDIEQLDIEQLDIEQLDIEQLDIEQLDIEQLGTVDSQFGLSLTSCSSIWEQFIS